MNPATTPNPTNSPPPVLCLSLELGVSEWKMAFSTALGQPPRRRTIPARDLARVEKEIEGAKAHFDLPSDARVVSC